MSVPRKYTKPIIEPKTPEPESVPNYVIYRLFNVHNKANFISAKMTWDDLEEALDLENPEKPYMIIKEDDIYIFYVNSPVGCYRIEVVD